MIKNYFLSYFKLSVQWKADNTGCECASGYVYASDVKSYQLEEDTGYITNSLSGFHGYDFTALANTTTDYAVSWPIDVTLKRFRAVTSSDMEGDILNIYMAKNKLIGLTTEDYNIGDNVISVANSQYLRVGYQFILDDTVNREEFPYILSIDGNEVTLSNSLSYNFLTGTQIRFSVWAGRNITIGESAVLETGASVLGRFIPKNVEITLSYTNLDPIADKSIVFTMALLYGQ